MSFFLNKSIDFAWILV